MTDNSNQLIDLINKNIQIHGYHITLVGQDSVPRFAYTIGLKDKIGKELVFPGGGVYLANDIVTIMNSVSKNLISSVASKDFNLKTENFGEFTLNDVDPSWANALLFGATDFYRQQSIPTLQIRPDLAHLTIDVPDLAAPWDPVREPVWRWLKEPWPLSIPSASSAITNMAALRGARITEASRWEKNEWELFAGSGPETPREEIRVVPIATLLAVDPSLQRVVDMNVGQSLWRDASENEWHDWA
jgi:hypothetical protein